MFKKIGKISAFLMIAAAVHLLFSCSGKAIQSEYDGLVHYGKRHITISSLSFDTLYVDGSSLSLDGFWLMDRGRLFFADKQLVGIREFDLNGQYLGRHIEKGNGPNEVIVPFMAATFRENGDLVTISNMMDFQIFDTLYQRKERYRLFSEYSLKETHWNDLIRNPDPEVNYMYEFNYDNSTKQIQCVEGNLLIPIVTEHIDYNGYSIRSNAKKFWKDSYIFAFIRLDSMSFQNKFGHYPPLYQKQNIPAFAKYSLGSFEGKIYSSFQADSLIYVRDSNGVLQYAIGYQAPGISKKFAETKSFDDYSLFFKTQLKSYGFYTDIAIVNGYLFRSYCMENESGYGMQIYRSNDLIGEILLEKPLKVFGEHNGYYYAVLPVDLENERYQILKFKL